MFVSVHGAHTMYAWVHGANALDAWHACNMKGGGGGDVGGAANIAMYIYYTVKT